MPDPKNPKTTQAPGADPLTGGENGDRPDDMGAGEELVEGGEDHGETGPEGGDAQPSRLEILMRKRGIKSEEELAELLENQDRKVTELTKDVRLRSLIPAAPPQRPRERPAPAEIAVPEDLYEILTDKEKSKRYINDLANTIRQQTRAEIQQETADAEYDRMYRRVAKKINEDPEKFARLQPIMVRLSERYRDADLDDLWTMAEEDEKADRKRRVRELTTDLLGEDADPGALKELVRKASPAPLSSSGGGGVSLRRAADPKSAEEKLKRDILGAKTLNA